MTARKHSGLSTALTPTSRSVVHGREVLKHLRQSPRSRTIPVIVLTSSDAEQDRNAMAELGVTRYLRKPLDLDEFMSIGRVIEDVLREYERA